MSSGLIHPPESADFPAFIAVALVFFWASVAAGAAAGMTLLAHASAHLYVRSQVQACVVWAAIWPCETSK